jgi:hypothetical protein
VCCGNHWRPVVEQAERDGVEGQTIDVVDGSVYRVGNPDESAMAVLAAFLLTENGDVGGLTLKEVANEMLGCQVGV